MPEIQIKHVISFSSEDKIHKAENMIKPETYRKWKCATPGEKNATIVLQFEKASQIHSIDIGNESSAFIEVLVGRASDTLNNFQVYLVASSFMSPIESRNETHSNRVRMFGADKFSQQLVNEKWDCVQIVCTQPFNKNITYGLSFIKFHSPPEKDKQSEEPKANDNATKLGAFKLKCDEEDLPPLPVGSWFGKRKDSGSTQSSSAKVTTHTATTFPDLDKSSKVTSQENSLKRKLETIERSLEPPAKKESQNVSASEQNQRNSLANSSNKDKVQNQKKDDKVSDQNPRHSLPSSSNKDKVQNQKKDDKMSDQNLKNSLPSSSKVQNQKKVAHALPKLNDKAKQQKPFHRIMDKVVFVISGFVNPLRSELRDKAIEMGARYKADWDKTCTHLICAFINTPKYIQVKKEGGRIVSPDWITDSYKKRTRMPWMKYILGKSNGSSDESDYTPDESESESEGSDYEPEPHKKESVKKGNSKNGKVQSNEGKASTLQKSQNSPTKTNENQASPKTGETANEGSELSETDDESAVADYMAKTDPEADSDCDTEDEIRKVEEKMKAKDSTENDDTKSKKDESPTKADLADLPLPNLPSFFKNRHFFLYGEFAAEKEHNLQRYITSYNGVIEDYMTQSVKYVITDSKWDKNFDEALADNEDLIFVKSQWVFKCHELKKLVPYQPYIVIPNS